MNTPVLIDTRKILQEMIETFTTSTRAVLEQIDYRRIPFDSCQFIQTFATLSS